MKFLSTYLAFFLQDRQMRQNVRALLKYVAFLAAVVALYATIFHVIMWQVEGQRHSWLSGFYWTLVVMSTLGFGDITFQSDLGRAFSVLVLVSGIILLLIVLPFTFIRYFYAPWLEARLRQRAPRQVPDALSGHVLMCAWDSIASGLVERLDAEGVAYRVIEPDPDAAARLHADGISVIAGEVDSAVTWQRAGAARARIVVANRDDVANANIVLTVREVAGDVPVAAVAAVEDSADILELSGATYVLQLKRQLGEQLANRVNAGHAEAHVIGRFRELLIAEFPVHNTPLAGVTIRESRLREIGGLSIVAVWDKARLLPADPDLVLDELSVPVVVGTSEMVDDLNEYLYIYDTNPNPVVVIGCGKVGRSATRALKRKGVPVHVIEKNPLHAERLGVQPERLIIGDAAQREVMEEAGLEEAPSVLLTTNDDAVNVYLSIYCRRLSPEIRIVSRITHDRNVDSMQRAGADLVLSYAALGVETIWSILRGRELVILGEGVELHTVPVPPAMAGKTLADAGIGARTGLTVIAIEGGDGRVTNPGAATVLEAGTDLILIGDQARVARLREEASA